MTSETTAISEIIVWVMTHELMVTDTTAAIDCKDNRL